MANIFSNIFTKKTVPQPAVNSEVTYKESVKLIERLSNDFATRSKQTIQKWRNALNQAESEISPNRTPLLEIYEELILDPTLTSCMEQRIERVLSNDFKLVDTEGQELKETNVIHKKWMYDLLYYLCETYFYGHTLLEVEGYNASEPTGFILIPRENVIPERMEIKVNSFSITGDFTYNDNPDCIEFFFDRKDLGLLHKIAPYILWKKEAIKSWSSFSETFGIPLKVGRTPSLSETDKSRLFEALRQMSSNASIVLGMDDKIDFISPNSSDAFDVFKQLIDQVDNEISKLILGQTMTSSNGSSYAQAKVHQEELNYRTTSDYRQIEFVMNDYVLPILKGWGTLPNKEMFFKFDYTERLSLSEQMNIDKVLIEKYQVSQEYLTDKYGTEFVETTTETPMVSLLGVGGTQALKEILIDPTMTPSQKEQILVIVFGFKPEDAKKVIQ